MARGDTREAEEPWRSQSWRQVSITERPSQAPAPNSRLLAYHLRTAHGVESAGNPTLAACSNMVLKLKDQEDKVTSVTVITKGLPYLTWAICLMY